MSSFRIEVRLDRVGAVFKAGETVTGVALVECPSSTSHGGITLMVDGTAGVHTSSRSNTAFDALAGLVAPVNMLSLSIPLAPKGTLPKGETEIPFAFALAPSSSAVPLLETYQGVHISSTYYLVASAAFTFSTSNSPKVTFNVWCPGQAHPTAEQLAADRGVDFVLTSERIKVKRPNGARVPVFTLSGRVDRYYNDIDTPLSGYVVVEACDTPITSLELQLVRAEYAATSDANATKDASEVQNIQIGDGDVMRGCRIPIHMMFPKWFTTATLLSTQMRVEFEVNIVVVLEGCNQIMQNVPLRLYRGR